MSKAERRDEMAEVLLALEGTGELAGAAAHDPLPAGRGFLAHDRRSSGSTGQIFGNANGFASFGRLARSTSSTCGMTSPARWMVTVSPIAEIDGLALVVEAKRRAIAAEAADVILVVERGVLDHDAADGDRLQARDRRERAGAADLDVDRQQLGGRLLGGELVGDRPARAAGAEAEAVLQREVVDLVDDAVDVVVEAGALRLDRAVGGERLVDVGADAASAG